MSIDLNTTFILSNYYYIQIQLHGYKYDTVFDYLDKSSLPDEYLPADYTGERAGTTQEIMGNNDEYISLM